MLLERFMLVSREEVEPLQDPVPGIVHGNLTVQELIDKEPQLEPVLAELLKTEQEGIRLSADYVTQEVQAGYEAFNPNWTLLGEPRQDYQQKVRDRVFIWQRGPGRFESLVEDMSVFIREVMDLKKSLDMAENNAKVHLHPDSVWTVGHRACPYRGSVANSDGVLETIYVRVLEETQDENSKD